MPRYQLTRDGIAEGDPLPTVQDAFYVLGGMNSRNPEVLWDIVVIEDDGTTHPYIG